MKHTHQTQATTDAHEIDIPAGVSLDALVRKMVDAIEVHTQPAGEDIARENNLKSLWLVMCLTFWGAQCRLFSRDCTFEEDGRPPLRALAIEVGDEMVSLYGVGGWDAVRLGIEAQRSKLDPSAPEGAACIYLEDQRLLDVSTMFGKPNLETGPRQIVADLSAELIGSKTQDPARDVSIKRRL